jgi:phosphohistidine phosphatase SixA
MPTRAIRFALLVLTLAATPARGDDAAWEALRGPGAVVVLRHSHAPGSVDLPSTRPDDCSTQRNLDANGRAQARRLGEAFTDRGITVGSVLSSPRCRCLDTGRLAFGKAEAWMPLIDELADAERRTRQAAEVRAAIATHREGLPLVLVTHVTVINDVTGRNIRMGAFLVLRPGDDGVHRVVGQIYVD